MVSEIQAERNSFYRLFWKFSRESTFIVLVCICMIAATISWFRAERAIDVSNQAQATSQTWQTMYKETERECRLAQVEIDDFRIVLIREGFNLDHIGEKP